MISKLVLKLENSFFEFKNRTKRLGRKCNKKKT